MSRKQHADARLLLLAAVASLGALFTLHPLFRLPEQSVDVEIVILDRVRRRRRRRRAPPPRRLFVSPRARIRRVAVPGFGFHRPTAAGVHLRRRLPRRLPRRRASSRRVSHRRGFLRTHRGRLARARALHRALHVDACGTSRERSKVTRHEMKDMDAASLTAASSSTSSVSSSSSTSFSSSSSSSSSSSVSSSSSSRGDHARRWWRRADVDVDDGARRARGRGTEGDR